MSSLAGTIEMRMWKYLAERSQAEIYEDIVLGAVHRSPDAQGITWNTVAQEVAMIAAEVLDENT